ncbi:hypothetical protein [Pectinatus brassicae]|uniref:hypothetical protein n=1 Tax=Pectinatus brassicae TaxID=862415 RepID=UPI0018C6296D|nr:hypothetical protein [Pectinatus brassicae]
MVEKIWLILLLAAQWVSNQDIIYSLLPRMEAVNIVKNYLDYNLKNKHNILDRQVSPRTLKVAGDINNMYHIGLGLIENKKEIFMIKQYIFKVIPQDKNERINFNMGSIMHGRMIESLPEQIAQQLHNTSARPYSQAIYVKDDIGFGR